MYKSSFSRLWPFLFLFTHILFWAFPYQTSAKTYQGQVFCNNQPLDSVRISSLLHKTSVFTKKDGSFKLETAGFNPWAPDSIVRDQYYNHTLRIPGSGKIHSFVSKKGNINISLIDLKGRQIEQITTTKKNRFYMNKRTASGVLFLQIDNKKPEPLLLIKNQKQKIVHQKQYNPVLITRPDSTVPDTLFFCKKGYTSYRAPIDKFLNKHEIRLQKKRWLASDIHNHTVLTDGGFIQDSLLRHAFSEGGLDVYMNAEHGGMFYLDTSGNYIIDDPFHQTNAPRYSNSLIPRWYTLKYFSWPKILGQRKLYPDKIILQGLEWNCPGHEHSTVGFINDSDQPDAIANFEYMFDFKDYDNSIQWLPKNNLMKHYNAIEGLNWLKNNYPSSSFFFINHPSREAIGAYTASDFRDFHNAAPQIFLGFEGMPGHHKSSVRGAYFYGSSEKNRTWGGADYILAKVGGVWDALLGEGRHIWIIVNSDFHYNTSDFWPGQYAKTWSSVTDTGALAWLEGVRSGEMFIVHGDLVSDLEFYIDDGVFDAPMGSDLHSSSREINIKIRFKNPPINNNGDKVKVDHIDLIRGNITGKIAPSDPAYYSNSTNTSTKVIKRFHEKDWITENGWNTMNTTVSLTQPAYFRLRGTNLAVGTPGETDPDGNPLMDLDDANSEQVAWNDLWFYSNPIFVYLR
ncbi:MAG: hypothetical protein GXY77_05445 [Fibrobacter sp.]|nr:hypothetical protein [Fibrobacter sp.]